MGTLRIQVPKNKWCVVLEYEHTVFTRAVVYHDQEEGTGQPSFPGSYSGISPSYQSQSSCQARQIDPLVKIFPFLDPFEKTTQQRIDKNTDTSTDNKRSPSQQCLIAMTINGRIVLLYANILTLFIDVV